MPVGFLASVTRGLGGEALTEMAELRDAGALGFTDDGKPVHRAGILRKALQYQRLAGGVLCLHEEDPTLSGRGVMHEGEVVGAARAGRHPVDLRVDADRPRRRARRLRGRAHPHPAPLSARESVEAVAEAKARGVRITAEASPHHLTLTDEALLRAARHAAEDEPAAAHRGRPPGADRGPARRHDRLHRHRPRAARARGEGGAVRGGADGHDRAGDRVRRASTPSWCCPASCRWPGGRASCRPGAALLDLPLPGDRGRASAPNFCLVDLEAEWEVGEAGYESRSENCCFAGRDAARPRARDGRRRRGRLPRAHVLGGGRMTAPTSCWRTASGSTATPSARPARRPARWSSPPACRATRSR